MARFDTRELGSWEQDVASLAGSLVHEVKNPLSTMNINAQLMLEEFKEPSTPKETRFVKRLNVMRSEIERIEQIVNSFLRFTREQILETEPGDLNALLIDLLEHNAEGLDRKGIRVHFHPGEDLPEVPFDDHLLRQCFLNLLLNAEHAMPEGGELILRSSVGEESGFVWVECIDTGQGIPEDRLAKIFRPYYSSKRDGTGLGLPTTLRIIRSHGGSIVVESDVGKGSRFIVSLPIEERRRDGRHDDRRDDTLDGDAVEPLGSGASGGSGTLGGGGEN